MSSNSGEGVNGDPPGIDVTGGRLSVLTFDRHDRDVVGLTYVYPVVSRRAKGVSIGINLNPNNACNWRCVYCQVPGLVRGSAPALDVPQLEQELDRMLWAAIHGDFLARHVEPEMRHLRDVAISGNGEPTSSPQLREALAAVDRAVRRAGITIPIVLITNGSLIDSASVKEALKYLASIGGRVWFKLDAGSDAGMESVNSARTRHARHVERLKVACHLCPTWVQSCWFLRAGCEPAPAEVDLYVHTLGELVRTGGPVPQGVYLYSLARPSTQPESAQLGPVSWDWLQRLGERLRSLGLAVEIAASED